ncbi:hypothetical protein [Halorubrum trueperi]|uniref:RDD family protein n=1 Tax=Halorubrum trueperi TaxID=2004704 RepID=A0ABD5UPJ3_9EURY
MNRHTPSDDDPPESTRPAANAEDRNPDDGTDEGTASSGPVARIRAVISEAIGVVVDAVFDAF